MSDHDPAVPMPEDVRYTTPAQLRTIAGLIESAFPGDARELREIADHLEVVGVYSEVRPARRVTFRLRRDGTAERRP